MKCILEVQGIDGYVMGHIGKSASGAVTVVWGHDVAEKFSLVNGDRAAKIMAENWTDCFGSHSRGHLVRAVVVGSTDMVGSAHQCQ